MTQQLIVVLGMHRSGTSLLTSMVEHCGVSAGDNLQPAGPDNPNGYWEDLFVLTTNNRLLALLGLQWCSLAWLTEEKITNMPEYDEMYQAAVSYLTDKLSQFPELVIKDPRMAMTLPFWNRVFAALNVEIKYIIAKRTTSSIIRSLVKRDGFDQEYATQLTYLHFASVCENMDRQAPSLVVEYEQTYQSEAKVKAKIAEFAHPNQTHPMSHLDNTTLFDEQLNHDVQPLQALDSGFVWQQEVLANFPHAQVDVKRIHQLEHYYDALSRSYDRHFAIRLVTNEILILSDNLKSSRVAIYGASNFASVLMPLIKESIVCCVDGRATEQAFSQFGFEFATPAVLVAQKIDVIVVCVIGQKEQITAGIAEELQSKLLFVEDQIMVRT